MDKTITPSAKAAASEADQGSDASVGYGKPPRATQFTKGQSGNPKGRGKSKASRPDSAFTLILDKTVAVKGQGKVKAHSIEEALQLKTYQEALKGKSMAVREVLRMILKRETWLAKHQPKKPEPIKILGVCQDPTNADEDLLRMGIACRNPDRLDWSQPRAQLLLEPWAVNLALSRLSRRRLTSNELDDIRRCTRDDGSINWPQDLAD